MIGSEAMSLELPALHPDDSVAVLIDRLKNGLRFPPDDEFGDEYCRTRAILRRHPLLKKQLPDFIVSSRTLADYRSYMQDRYAKEYEWDAHSGNDLSLLQERLRSGSALDGYTVQREVGWGGFGRVYLAHHNFLDRPFAIKFFQPVFHQGGGTALSRFFQEASMLYDLHHPHIIAVRDVGLYQERPFIVMDYFDGSTLNNALIEQGSMPPTKAISMAEMLSDATQHAHERDIVHRDIKPSNIMLKPNDCKIIDFGLGVYIEQHLHSRLTRPGETPASGHYTARELLADPTLVDPRSDIYSIGAVWYTAVTNDVPAGANLADSLLAVKDLPDSHRDIILRCLSDAQHRFATCKELLAVVRQAINQETTK